MHATSLVFQGTRFVSIKALAEFVGLKPLTLAKRIREGWTIERACTVAHGTKKPIVVNGLEFDSVKTAAAYFGVEYENVLFRMKTGWSIEQAFECAPVAQGDECDGVVYVITNSVNRKKYVGITTRGLEHRAKQHVNYFKAGMSGKLYAAMAEIGLHKFRIREIERVNSRRLLSVREKHWISHYNSVQAGYNSFAGGASNARNADYRVEIDGRVFLNAHTAAAHKKVCTQTVHRWLKNGIARRPHALESVS